MIFSATFILLWFRTNYPPYRELADMYIIFFIIGTMYWTLDFVVSLAAGKNQINPPPYTQIINTITVEKNTIIGPLPFSMKIGTYVFTVAMCIFFAFYIGASETTILKVPSFQIVDLGMAGVAIVTIAMAIGEDFIFFGLLAPTVSGIGRVISMGNQVIGVILSIIITPITFVMYHFLVYGATDLSSSMFVWMFATVVTSYTLVFRTLVFAHCLHVTNNITLKIASAIGVAAGA